MADILTTEKVGYTYADDVALESDRHNRKIQDWFQTDLISFSISKQIYGKSSTRLRQKSATTITNRPNTKCKFPGFKAATF